jgi:ABC-2 type transport system ATP-binding protein
VKTLRNRATWTYGPSKTEVRGAAHEATALTRRRSPAVAVEDVHKSYGDLKAVDGISFTVGEGEFFGILGPNGAGKTTTLEMVEGLREPDSGTVTLLGERPWPRNPRLLPRIGVQLQASSFFERLTAREQFETFGSLYGVSRGTAAEMLELVGLTDRRGVQENKLSGGERQRLSIACALVHDPDVVFLDEPTAALDPQAAQPVGRLARDPAARQDDRLHHALPGRGGDPL